MNRVYICSPYRGDVTRNAAAAREYCRFAVAKGKIPVAPHLFYTQFLNDNDPADRRRGMDWARDDLLSCEAVWVFDENGVSEGMRGETEFARYKLPVFYMQLEFDEWKWRDR